MSRLLRRVLQRGWSGLLHLAGFRCRGGRGRRRHVQGLPHGGRGGGELLLLLLWCCRRHWGGWRCHDDGLLRLRGFRRRHCGRRRHDRGLLHPHLHGNRERPLLCCSGCQWKEEWRCHVHGLLLRPHLHRDGGRWLLLLLGLELGLVRGRRPLLLSWLVLLWHLQQLLPLPGRRQDLLDPSVGW